MEAVLNIQVDRLRSHPSGNGWRVMIDSRTWIERDDGSGLTLAEAEEALDRLDAQLNRCGVEQLAARETHNLEVAGANPAPATDRWSWN